MNSSITEEQAELQAMVGQFLGHYYGATRLREAIRQDRGIDVDSWAALTSLGINALGVEESAGGAGATITELGLVLETMGARLLSSPYFASTALAAQALALFDPEGQGALISRIRDGEVTATLACPLGVAGWEDIALRATLSDSVWHLSGALTVIDGATADVIVALADTDFGVGAFVVDPAQVGVVRERIPGLDPTRAMATVAFSDVVATRLEGVDTAKVERLFDVAIIALAAEQLGGAQHCLESMVEYAKIRAQHGQAIGSFQAVKHLLVDVLMHVDGARTTVLKALTLAEHGEAISLAASTARVSASVAFTSAAEASIQVHGGIGFDWEHDAHLYLKRAKSSELLFGSVADHVERIARLVGPVRRELLTASLLPEEAQVEAEDFRREVQQFLEANLPAGFAGYGAVPEAERQEWLERWRQRLVDNGLMCISWPKEYGGQGRSFSDTVVLAEELARAGVPGRTHVDGIGMGLLGPTVLALGAEEQKRTILPLMVSGERRWCQGYSEPNAGSDLAALQTFAEQRDGKWVINGQKIWTTSAHEADWIFLLARTDRSVTKHRGLTFLLVPLDQPGVEVRPLYDATGRHHLNEVFFTDATTSLDNVLGEVNGGWAVANALLTFERGDSAVQDSINLSDELRRLFDLAEHLGRADDVGIRSRLARAYVDLEGIRLATARDIETRIAGRDADPMSAIHKLRWSEYHQRVTTLALDVLGAAALAPSGRSSSTLSSTDVPGSPSSSLSWVQMYLAARAGTIYAGTSQIQRNIIGERVLGLPRPPRVS